MPLRGHIANACKKLVICNTDGCERRHRPLVHDTARVFLPRTGKTGKGFRPEFVSLEGKHLELWVLLHMYNETTLVKHYLSSRVGVPDRPTTVTTDVQ